MNTRPRTEVLHEVNEVLAHEGLPLWNLKRIGRHRNGENEIVGLSHVIKDLEQYYVILMFDVIRPDGSMGKYGVRATTHIPTCLICTVNGKLLFVRQHRLTTGSWMVELPRGWVRSAEADGVSGGVAQALLEREVGSDWVAKLNPVSPVLLGSVWEDTGTRFDQVQIHLVELETDLPLPHGGRNAAIKTALYDQEQVEDMLTRGKINDQTTLTALFLRERYLRTRSV